MSEGKSKKKKDQEGEEKPELVKLQDVVLESSAQFDALQQLYRTNANYKACSQDQNRIGVLDCEIILAHIKCLRALECPFRAAKLQAFRQHLLDEALEQIDSAEQVRGKVVMHLCSHNKCAKSSCVIFCLTVALYKPR